MKVVLEFVIRKFPCLITTPDQVITRCRLRAKVVHDGPKSTPDPITDHCVADLSTNCVRYCHRRDCFGYRYETDSYRPTLTPSRRCRKQRKLPSGSNPIGHVRLDRQLVTALVAAGLKYGTAGTGTHSSAKTVGFRPLSLIWLIGTLHKILFSSCFDALRGTPEGSLARYCERSYLTDLTPPAKRSKWVYGDSPCTHEGRKPRPSACG
jgi:hypothetical protein